MTVGQLLCGAQLILMEECDSLCSFVSSIYYVTTEALQYLYHDLSVSRATLIWSPFSDI